MVAVQAVGVHRQAPLLRLHWVKGEQEAGTVREKWNSSARIRVGGQADVPQYPPGWGLSPVLPMERRFRHPRMNIDGSAQTYLSFSGGGRATWNFCVKT